MTCNCYKFDLSSEHEWGLEGPMMMQEGQEWGKQEEEGHEVDKKPVIEQAERLYQVPKQSLSN